MKIKEYIGNVDILHWRQLRKGKTSQESNRTIDQKTLGGISSEIGNLKKSEWEKNFFHPQ